MADSTMLDMLSRLMAAQNDEATPNLDLQELMGSQDLSPKARLLTQLLSSQLHQSSAIDDAVEVEDIPPPPGRGSRARPETARRIRAHVEEMRAQIQELEDCLLTLAHALGACPNCWGDHDGCSSCRGRGSPGHFVPNARLYKEWIEPAVRRRNGLQTTRPEPAQAIHAPENP